VPARLRTAGSGKDAARIGLETKRANLRAVSFSIEAKAIRDWEAGMKKPREIGRFGPEATSVCRFGSGKGNQERHQS
jgi:hypothetical protein